MHNHRWKFNRTYDPQLHVALKCWVPLIPTHLPLMYVHTIRRFTSSCVWSNGRAKNTGVFYFLFFFHQLERNGDGWTPSSPAMTLSPSVSLWPISSLHNVSNGRFNPWVTVFFIHEKHGKTVAKHWTISRQ